MRSHTLKAAEYRERLNVGCWPEGVSRLLLMVGFSLVFIAPPSKSRDLIVHAQPAVQEQSLKDVSMGAAYPKA